MKRFLLRLAIILTVLSLLIILYLRLFVHEQPPIGKAGPAADSLAIKVQTAINKAAWDSTTWVSWTYSNRNHYLWNKAEQMVRVSWDDTEVMLNTATLQGTAKQNGSSLSGKPLETALHEAWKRFCNDTFWLNAPAKLFDDGTERGIINDQDLMITYKSGGVTPGDTYVWKFGPDYLPRSYRMWVKVLPIGGLEATWEDWVTLPTGARVSTTHRIGGITFRVTDLKGGMAFPGW